MTIENTDDTAQEGVTDPAQQAVAEHPSGIVAPTPPGVTRADDTITTAIEAALLGTTHDSAPPMSRKLAPPPKPKRDSGAASSPPSARPGEGPELLASSNALKAPIAPTISYPAELAEKLDPLPEVDDQGLNVVSSLTNPLNRPPPIPRRRSNPALADGEEADADRQASARAPSDPLLAANKAEVVKPVTSPPRPLTLSPSPRPRSESPPPRSPTPSDAPAQVAVEPPAPALPGATSNQPSSAPKASASSAIFAMRIIAVGESVRPPPVSEHPSDLAPDAYLPSASRLGTGVRRSSRPTMARVSEPDVAVPAAKPAAVPAEARPALDLDLPIDVELPGAVPIAADGSSRTVPLAEPHPLEGLSSEAPIAVEPLLAEPLLAEPLLAVEPLLAEPLLAEPLLAEPLLAEPLLAEVPPAEARPTESALVEAPLVEAPLVDLPLAEALAAERPSVQMLPGATSWVESPAAEAPFAAAVPAPLPQAESRRAGMRPPPPPPPEELASDAVLDAAARKIAADAEELDREDAISMPPEEVAALMAEVEGKSDAIKPPPPPKRSVGTPPSTPPTVEGAAAPREVPAPDLAAAKAAQRSKTRQPWWEDLFNEDFMRASSRVADEQIRREVTFIEESLGVAAGGVVLDLGCGTGHHAVEFASRGYGIVGYDLSLYQLALAADVAQERGQKINFLQGDMREMAFEEMFDGVFCWNTTFGYFEEDKNLAVAQRVFKALRPGGMFLVDVINRDFAAASAPCTVWYEGDACVCMDDMSVDYISSRLRVKRSIILDDGRTKESLFSLRLYSLHELGKLLHEVGFRVTEASGHPATPGVFFGPNSPRIIMLAQRP